MAKEEKALERKSPKTLTYQYYVQARNGKKRDYIYDFSKARKCPHPTLVATAMGGNTYRCTECNYFYTIVTAYAEPMHLATVKAAYQLLHFSKEFGADALQEVLRQPHGQSDGSPQKGVLPEGMTFADAMNALEAINVTTPDRGAAELKALVESTWPSEVEMRRRIKALQGSSLPEKQAEAKRLEGLLEARNALTSGRAEVPALPETEGNALPGGDS